jgi:hypothetical protein
MLSYRRRLPHWIPDHAILFITWRLAGSAPPRRSELLTVSGPCRIPFIQQDERLARLSTGPFWLRDPRIASMLAQALRYGEMVLLGNTTCSPGDHALGWVRSAEEMNELISYVEHNPVQAGLVGREDEWPWSSARTEADDRQRSSAPPELSQM